MSEKVICNHSHCCTLKDDCVHRGPHDPLGAGCEKGIGGGPSKCPSGQITTCVFLDEDMTYRQPNIVWCDYCGGAGRWTEYRYYRVRKDGSFCRILDPKTGESDG